MRKMFLAAALILSVSCAGFAETDAEKGMFIVSPMSGLIRSEAYYTVPGAASKSTLSDDGTLYGIYTMYVKPQFNIGTLLHMSPLSKSQENGALLFGYYYFMRDKKFQPAVGLAIENISIYSEVPGSEVAPLLSMDVRTNVLTIFPTVGVAYKESFNDGNLKLECTPFVGYFNEQVDVTINSPGQKIGTSVRNGFKSSSNINLDYSAAGLKVVLKMFHFINFDSKVYWRFKDGYDTLYTIRSRLDIYLSEKLGITVKNDYFKDDYETNTFTFIGPSFVF